MDKQVRVTLHKVKKGWIILCLSSLLLSLAVLVGPAVQADEMVTTGESALAVAATPQISEASQLDQTATSSVSTTDKHVSEPLTETADISEKAPATQKSQSLAAPQDVAAPELIAVAEDSTHQQKAAPVQEVEAAVDLSVTEAVTLPQPPQSDGRNAFASDQDGNWYYFDSQGQALTGFQTVDGVALYFHEDGVQAKGQVVTVGQDTYAFDKDSGALLRHAFASDTDGYWYFLGDDGKALKGQQVVDGYSLYFYTDGRQAKDAFIILDGASRYFQKDSGQMARRTFLSDDDGQWYYFDQDGRALTGAQVVDTFELYFHEDGVQAKGELIRQGGQTYFYDRDNGRKVKDATFVIGDKTYKADEQGRVSVYRSNIRDGYLYNNKGKRVSEGIHTSFLYNDEGHFYYLEGIFATDREGKLLTGRQLIESKIGVTEGYYNLVVDGRVILDSKESQYFNEKSQAVINGVKRQFITVPTYIGDPNNKPHFIVNLVTKM